MSQFNLLKSIRFGPFFWTQCCGAFNDNVFKNALLMLIAFQGISLWGLTSGMLINLASGLFILPFFLLSATAGQIADKYEKSRLIRYIKLLEIIIMLLAIFAFYLHNIVLLLTVLLLLGCQATLFGPVKYSILPQHLKTGELLGGNGMVEMGTFVAILLGTIVGGIVISFHQASFWLLASILLGIAIIGFMVSLRIPKAPSTSPNLSISFNIVKQTWRNIQFARANRAVFLSILGASWFWFFGAVMLQQVPGFTHLILHGNEHLATLILAAFCVGIGLGSILCEKLSTGNIEIGLVPIGALGLTLFTWNLWRHSAHFYVAMNNIGAWQFLTMGENWRIIANLMLIGLSGGLFTVPLYTLIQHRSDATQRSRIIAANNIFNAIFMVAASLIVMLLLHWGYTIPQIFLIMSIANFFITAYIFTLVPEFIMRFLSWCIISALYRLRPENIEAIPEQGAALLICNHISFIDALIIAACIHRPVRFVMHYAIFNIPILKFIFKTSKAIAIAGGKEDKIIKEQAFSEIAAALAQGDLVCIFPEGGITRDGELKTFRPGVERIIRETPVPVIPMALKGVWGTFFSFEKGPAMRKIPRRFRAPIGLVVGESITPEDAKLTTLQAEVLALRGDCL